MTQAELENKLGKIRSLKDNLVNELQKIIVGQEDIIDQLLITLLAQGHCLLTGVPGLGKTLLVKSLAQALDLTYNRIQFTPDLMPADIIGSEIVEEDVSTGKRHFRFIKGPVFAQILLADEINRTPPKTQAALLEAMAEKHVTVAGVTHNLIKPFFVLATQNPIELEGTYPLPEAQLDRFLMNCVMTYLPEEQEVEMAMQTTRLESKLPEPVMDANTIIDIQNVVREVPVSTHVAKYTVRLVSQSRPSEPVAPQWVKKQIKWGAGSRASQALILAGKARALLDGRYTVAIEDIQSLAGAVLRHRIIPHFHAEADGLTSDNVITKLLNETPED